MTISGADCRADSTLATTLETGRAAADRAVLEEILFVLLTGCRWRDPPLAPTVDEP